VIRVRPWGWGATLRVLRSKTAVIPVNPSLLPQSEDDIERRGGGGPAPLSSHA